MTFHNFYVVNNMPVSNRSGGDRKDFEIRKINRKTHWFSSFPISYFTVWKISMLKYLLVLMYFAVWMVNSFLQAMSFSRTIQTVLKKSFPSNRN